MAALGWASPPRQVRIGKTMIWSVGHLLPLPPQTEIIDPKPSPTPIYFGRDLQTSPTTPLPVDPSFGYRLPDDVGLTHQIEASTNLVEWAPLTNAFYYFSDQDS